MSTERRKIDQDIDPTVVTDGNARKVTVYCIKTCNTCRTAKAELDAAGFAVFDRDVRAKDMGLDDWQDIEEMVGWDAMVNRKSQTWRNIDETEKSGLDRDGALSLLLKHPTLMKRPIIDMGDRMLVGWSADTRKALGLEETV